MADEIEITNVGGPRPRDGVASEATLQALLLATERRLGSSAAGTQDRIQQNYNKAVKESTTEVSKLGKAAEATGAAFKRAAKELAFGGDRASDFAEAIFGATNVVTRLTRFLDHTVDQFRSLSSVGASFENSIFEMIKGSAAAAMNLDEFAQMVRDNAQNMAFFGGTVTNGARLVGEFSNEFRSGIGRQFFAMGFTIEDINEGLIDFLANERMRQTQNLRFDGQTQESAANYIMQLDKLAKLTGEERRQLADRMAQQMTEARIRNQLNSLGETERNNLRSAITFFDTRLPGFSDAFQDLMDGVAQTDLGRALANQIPGITEYMQRVFTGEESLEEVIRTLQNDFGPQIQRFSSAYGPSQLTAMENSSSGVVSAIAQLANSAYQMNSIMGLNADQAGAEQGQRDRLTASLSVFEQAIRDIRQGILNTFFDIIDGADGQGGLVEALSNFGGVLSDLLTTGPNGLPRVGGALRNFIDMIFGPDGFVTRGVRRFTRFIESGGFQEFMEDMQTRLQNFVDYLSGIFTDEAGNFTLMEGLKTLLRDTFSNIMDFLFGEIQSEPGGEGRGQRSGGMFNRITESISEFFTGTEFGRSITDGISNAFTTIDNKLSEMLGMEGDMTVSQWLTEQLTAIRDTFTGEGGVLSYLNSIYEDMKGWIGTGDESLSSWFDRQLQTIEGMVASVTSTLNSTVQYFRDALGFGEGQSLREWFDSTWASIQTTMTNITTTINSVMATIANTFGFGENGQTFSQWMDTTLTDLQTRMTSFIESQVEAVRGLLGMAQGETFNEYISRMTSTVIDQLVAGFNRVIDTLVARMGELVTAIRDSTVGGVGGMKLGDSQAQDIATRFMADPSSVTSEERNDLIQYLRAREEEGSWVPGIIRGFRDVTNDLINWDSLITSDSTLRQALADSQMSFQYGTNGFQNFGRGSIAALHGNEAVVPRNSEAGELLQAFYDSQSGRSGASGSDQTQLIQKLDQLNNNMRMAVQLLNEGLSVEKSIVKNTRGSTNLYRSLGR